MDDIKLEREALHALLEERFRALERTVERRIWQAEQQVRMEWQARHAELERRVARLEEAERKRQEGKGA